MKELIEECVSNGPGLERDFVCLKDITFPGKKDPELEIFCNWDHYGGEKIEGHGVILGTVAVRRIRDFLNEWLER